MSDALRLFYHRSIYDLEGTERLFVRAVRDNVRHHQERCPEYAQILESRGFSPDFIRTADDLAAIPPIPTLYLKRHTLYSAPPKHLMLKSTTSGTSGTVSTMGLDVPSALRGLGMVLGMFFNHRLVTLRPAGYIVLGYEPAKRNKIGAVKTAYASTFAAPAVHREFALKDTGTEYVLNWDGIKKALLRYEKDRLPVRLIGFPAYFMFLLRELGESGIRLRLHPKSLVLLAGGWKRYFTEQVDKPTIYAMSEETLGLGGDRIREFFGAVEHPIAYFDCPNHHFHVPVYSRVMVRDENLRPVGFGEPGLLNLITPMMTSMPFTSVMTDDVAVLHPGSECGCGIQSPYFEILGRAGLADIKTCAAGASELLGVLKGGGAA
ncbi:MAG TPA: acyl-protein synthetase [Armatimonadota bacterium]|nr:acyl-protein synthetase [Armatimonadota bacterium]